MDSIDAPSTAQDDMFAPARCFDAIGEPVTPTKAKAPDPFVWWRADDPDIIIQSQPAVMVYESTYGAILIRQESASGDDDEDQVVRVRPENLAILIQALRRHLPK